MLRHFLYEAAGCLLTTVTAPSALRSWGLSLAERLGPKRARTAVARKLAVLLLGLWKREDHFRAAPGADVRSSLSEIERAMKFSGHSLRAGLPSSAEVDERCAQKWLGHASAEMTRRY